MTDAEEIVRLARKLARNEETAEILRLARESLKNFDTVTALELLESLAPEEPVGVGGHYDPKHQLTDLSMDEIQRIIAGLHMLRDADNINNLPDEAARSASLIGKVTRQEREAVSGPMTDEFREAQVAQVTRESEPGAPGNDERRYDE